MKGSSEMLVIREAKGKTRREVFLEEALSWQCWRQ